MKIFCAFILAAAFASSVFSQEAKIKLYFPNEKLDPNLEDCRKNYPVNRKIPKTRAVAKAALEEFFKGVSEAEKEKGFTFYSASEMEGIFKSINIKNKTAYLNFSSRFPNQMGNASTSCGGAMFFSALEKTLKQFPAIKNIYYAIEGDPAEFYEWAQVGECPKALKNCDNKNFIK